MNKNKWKGSFAAKAAAWILLTISAVCFVASMTAIAWMMEEHIYESSREETREKLFSEITSRYSLIAAYHYCHGGEDDGFQKTLEDSDFQYGIIEASSLEGLDVSDEKIYAVNNFSRKVAKEELQICPVDLSPDDSLHYREGLLFGYAYLRPNHDSTQSYYVDKICYDTSSGILYYKTLENVLYPVQKVSLYDESGSVSYEFLYQFDFAKKQYQKVGSSSSWGGEDEYEYRGAADEEMELLLSQDFINFAMLEEQGIAREEWGRFLLDDVREIPAEELMPVNVKDSGWKVTRTTEYYLDENYTLHAAPETGKVRHYIVVSLWPDNLPEGWSENLFVQANTLVNWIYAWRYPALFVFSLSLILGIGSFCFLMAAAGRRRGTEEIVLLPIDKMWLDALAVLTLAGESIIIMLLDVVADSFYSLTLPALCLAVLLALCGGWLLLWFLLSFAVRVKKGKWWRNTLIYKICASVGRFFYKICASVGRFFEKIWQNMGFLWRWLLVMAALAVFEFCGIVVLGVHQVEVLIFVWFLEKALLYTLIIWGLIQMKTLKEGGERIAAGDLEYKIDTNHMMMDFKRHGENINRISEGMARAVEERMKSERFKTELITNVSHDIKTPLTSIINYVDLLEKEKLENATAEEYLEVLERQSARLKKLIEDLMEASKAVTGNLEVHLERLEAGVFMVQTVGEFEEKTKAAELDLRISKPEQPVYIMADGRHFWRVIDNLMNNICKYAQPGTRVYIDMEIRQKRVAITFRNTSRYPLNMSSEALMERFARGDSSRNTEGNGLGLSIANSLMDIMGGSFQLCVDGDLFKVILEFDEADPPGKSADAGKD